MPDQKSCSQLFEDEPRRWGLRGDPFLWREMQTTLKDHAWPASADEFQRLLEQTYAQLTGTPITRRTSIFVERYSHGGMSSGLVSPEFWRETAIPLLLDRYRDAK